MLRAAAIVDPNTREIPFAILYSCVGVRVKGVGKSIHPSIREVCICVVSSAGVHIKGGGDSSSTSAPERFGTD